MIVLFRLYDCKIIFKKVFSKMHLLPNIQLFSKFMFDKFRKIVIVKCSIKRLISMFGFTIFDSNTSS